VTAWTFCHLDSTVKFLIIHLACAASHSISLGSFPFPNAVLCGHWTQLSQTLPHMFGN